GVGRLQVREAAAKVACCGLLQEALLLRLLLDEVERLQEIEGRYLPRPLPTGWVLLSEQEPEEGVRCEVEFVGLLLGSPTAFATYWAGREGDFPIWTGPQGEWYHDTEVRRYRYAPATRSQEQEVARG
ncbi:hypothetical protein I3A86_24410, partial [Salmonella enterica]|nr:hypothetical protein [Salmonella enterica]